MILVLLGVFLLVFGGSLLIFQFPIQGDDLGVVMSLVLDHLSLFEHSEFRRSVVEGTGCYVLQNMLTNSFKSLSSNVVLFGMFWIHFVNAVLLYLLMGRVGKVFSIRLFSQKRVALVSALLFLLSGIVVENYTNVAMAIRMTGMIFIFLHYFIILYLFENTRKRDWPFEGFLVISLGLTSILAFSFYEIYLFFLIMDLALLFLKPTRKTIILEWVFLLGSYFLVKALALMNITLFTFSSGGLRWDVAAFIKTGLFYLSTILLPNVHGKILMGAFLHFPVVILSFIGLALLLKNKKSDAPLIATIGISGLIVALFLGLIFHNYYAPRLLYPISPLLAVLVAMGLFGFRDRLAYILIGLLLLADVGSFLHFASMQDRAYKFMRHLQNSVLVEYQRNKKLVVDYYPSGIRVFFPSPATGEWERFVRAVVKTSGEDERKIKLKVEFVKKHAVDTSGKALDLFLDRLQNSGENTFVIQKR